MGSGERVASVSYQVTMGDRRGWIRLRYTRARWDGTKHDVESWIELVTTPQPFGGRRWWFLCPEDRTRVAKLHLPSGASTFASQRAYRLAYNRGGYVIARVQLRTPM